jgi:hypothetical protein
VEEDDEEKEEENKKKKALNLLRKETNEFTALKVLSSAHSSFRLRTR